MNYGFPRGSPRWLPGDLVLKEPIVAAADGWTGRLGVVVGVTLNDGVHMMPIKVYPYVYYVFFNDKNFEGPLFHSELHSA